LKVRLVSAAMLILSAVGLVACGGEASTSTPVPAIPTAAPAQSSGPNDHILIQHILIGFKDAVGFRGSPPAKAAARTQDQAKALAYNLLAQAKDGANFDQLVAANTDDQAPGIYALANTGITPGQGEYSRDSMVPAFGNVGFSLQPGQIGIADYDPATSPYGWHIIKRLH
jgi:PPIC-type PPIASE domain